MHFSKTYSQLLLTLPPELQENAIEYRQLKKLINKVVLELSSLGLSPSVLHSLFQSNNGTSSGTDKGKQRALGERPGDLNLEEISVEGLPGPGSGCNVSRSTRSKAIYEVVHDGDRLQPRLRVWVGTTQDSGVDQHGTEEPQTPVSDSRVAIFLDRPESKPSTPAVEKRRRSDIFDAPKDDLLLVSKPLVAEVGRSSVWSLQRRRTSISGDTSAPFDDGWSPESSENVEDELTAHPVELVTKQMRVSADGTRELIIPLTSDTDFFELLHTALQSLAGHLLITRTNFVSNLEGLARSISLSARPQSSISRTRSFLPFSLLGDPQSVGAPRMSPFSSSFIPGGKSKSDLYAWREIFQLYVEAEVFESVSERDRGERDIIETERRLALFAERVAERGLSDSRKLKLKRSREALETFLELNVLIVNLKKFQLANAEAARKILKKHAKRTALPFPLPQLNITSASSRAGSQMLSTLSSEGSCVSSADILALIPATATSLPHILVQAIGETLLPIIPHIDDYSCLICTSIAFRPIRLNCGHLFCVRCLVKMQKRGQDHCPCCRSLTVLKADRSNVDWALFNFMQDWFPQESALKLKQNEKEAAQEELAELGIVDQGCIIA